MPSAAVASAEESMRIIAAALEASALAPESIRSGSSLWAIPVMRYAHAIKIEKISLRRKW